MVINLRFGGTNHAAMVKLQYMEMCGEYIGKQTMA